MELKAHLTNRSWGKLGADSVAGCLFWNTMKRNKIQKDISYSELIIAATPDLKCIIKETGSLFSKFILNNPTVLGRCKDEFENKLPFIVKVLSVKIPTAVKFHPDKDEAEALLEARPTVFTDLNHKPKLIIALTCFQVLCGLRPPAEIIHFLLAVPELAIVIPETKQEDYVHSPTHFHLRDILHFWLTATHDQMKLSLDMLLERLNSSDRETKSDLMYGLLLKLHKEHGYDNGVYAPYFFNYIFLNPKEAIFIKCGLPYCYISGDSIQCSTCSNNAFLLAFTSISKDIATAVRIMDLDSYIPEDLILKKNDINDTVTSYIPPVSEFAVDIVQVKSNTTCSLPVHNSFSMFLVTKGKATSFIRPTIEGFKQFKMGTIIFLFPYQKITLTAEETINLFQFYPNTQ